MNFICKAIMLNGNEPTTHCRPATVEAINAKRAAVAYAHRAETWDELGWQNGDEAIVEIIESASGPAQRMVVRAYETIDFCPSPDAGVADGVSGWRDSRTGGSPTPVHSSRWLLR